MYCIPKLYPQTVLPDKNKRFNSSVTNHPNCLPFVKTNNLLLFGYRGKSWAKTAPRLEVNTPLFLSVLFLFLFITPPGLDRSLGELARQLVHLLVLELDDWLLLSLLGLLDELLGPLLNLLFLFLLFFLLIRIQLLEIAQAVKTPVVLNDNVAAKLLLALLQQLLQEDNRLVVLGELVAVELNLLERGESLLRSLGKALETSGGDVVVLQAQNLEVPILALSEGLAQKHTALGTEKRVADAQLEKLSPAGRNLGQSLGALQGECVVLEVQHSELRSVTQTLAKQIRNTLLPNAVLNHLDFLDLVVQAESLGPGGHAAVFQPVATADDCLEVGHILSLLARLLLLCVELRERIGDQDTGVGAQAVVVEVEVLQGDVCGEEGDEWRLCVEAKSVVVEVDGVELGEVQDGGKEGGKGLWDFVEKATGEDIGEVGNLSREWLVQSPGAGE